MALSMDEQRVLAEIERRLSDEDPRLAASMSSFRRPRPTVPLRSPRARILGSLFTVALVAMISLMVYAVIPFRTAQDTRNNPGSVSISAAPGTGAAKTAATHTSAAAATGVTAHASSPAARSGQAKASRSG